MDLRLITSDLPGFDTLYVMDDPLTNAPFRGEMEVHREEARALLRGELTPKQPVIVRHTMGGTPRDVIWTTYAGPMIVRNTVVELFRAHEFTGWKTFPVEVYDRKGQNLPGYVGLAVYGRCGPIDNAQSEVIPHKYRPSGSPVLRGLYFDPSSWDGSDFFMTSTTTWVFVRDSVKVALERAKVTNIAYRKLTEVECRRVPSHTDI